MAQGTIDNLNIQVSAKADEAVKSLKSLTSSLNSINAAFSKDIAGMRKFSKEVGTMAAAIKSFGNIKVNIPDLKGLNTTFKTLKDSNGITAAENLKKVADSMASLGKANFNDSGINKTINALKRLAEVDMSKFDSGAFGKISNVISTMGSVPDISSSVNRFVSSMARLSNAGERTGQTANDIRRLGGQTRLAAMEMQSIGAINNDVNIFVQSMAKLSSAGGKTSQTVAGLKVLSKETVEFFKAMQNAPKVSENTIRMTQALAQLASAGGRVGTATSTISTSFEKMSSVSSKALSAIKKLASGMLSAFSQIGRSSKNINTATLSLGNLLKTAIGFRIGYGILEFGKMAFELGSDITEVENVVNVAFGEMSQKAYDFAKTATEQFGLSELAAKRYSGTMMSVLNASGVAQRDAAEMSTTLTGLAGDLASFYNISQDNAWEKIMSGMAGEIEPLRRLGINLSVVNLEAYALSQGITESYQSMTQAEQVMLRYNYLMAQTTQQQGDFQRTVGSFANQWRLLTLNVQQFSATIGQGLISAVLPAIQAINALFSVLQKAAIAFRNFMYVLTGYKGDTSGGFVNDIATGIEGIGDAGDAAAGGLGDAGDAADDLKEKLSVLPFDELNQLSDNLSDAGSGGSGGGGMGDGGLSGLEDFGNITDAFAESDLPEYINEWAERIREAFLDHDWDKLGEEIAWGINVGINAIYDAINWDNVGPKITAFTTAFTQTFNSLVSNINWEMLGRTIGAGINTLVNTLNQLITGIDWINLGKSFADGIMGIVDEVNWKNLGNLIGNYFMISWDIFYGYVKNLDYSKIGQSLADGLNGVVESIDLSTIGSGLGTALTGALDLLYEFAENVDWGAIGDEIADGINSFFDDFSFSKLAKTLNSWVRGLEKALFKAISKIDWGDIFEGLTDFVGNLDLDVAFLVSIPAINKLKNALGKIDTQKITDGFKTLKNIFTSDDFFGSLGDQIKKMQSNMSSLQKGAIGVVGVFAEFSLVKDGFADIVSGSDNIVESLAKIVAGAGAAAAALKLIGLSNPLTAAITGAVALAGAIAGISSAMEDTEFAEYIENLKTLSEEVQNNSNEIIENSKASQEYVNTAGVAEVALARDLADKYYDLAGKTNLAAGEKMLLAEYAQDLAEIIPGLNDYIDSETGLLTIQKDTLEGLISNTESYYKLQAAKDSILQAYKDQISAQESLKNLTAELTPLQEAYNEKMAELNELSEQRNNNEITYEEFSAKWKTAYDELGNIKTAVDELVPAWDLATAALASSTDQITFLNGIISETGTSLNNWDFANAAIKSLNAIEEMGGIWENGKQILGEKAVQIQQEIEKGLTPDENGYYTLASGAVVYYGKGLEDSKGNIKATADSAFVQTLKEILGEGYDISYENGRYAISGYNEGIADGTSESITAVDNWLKSMDDETKSYNDSHSPSELYKRHGRDAVLGYNEGISENIKSTVDVTKTWLSSANKEFVNSEKNGTYETFGKNIVARLLQGLKISGSEIQNAINPILTSISNSFSPLNSDLYTIGRSAIQSFINGFRSMTIPMPHITVSGWNQLSLGNGGIMSIPNFGVNWYAAGGLFRNATIAGIGEAGDEAVLPLENRRTMRMIADSIVDSSSGGFGMNEETMANAVARGVAMAMMNNQSSQPNVTVYAELRTEDDEVLARAVARGQEKIDYRMNPTPQF